MRQRTRVSAVLAGLLSLVVTTSASAGPVVWTDWTSATVATAGSASGVLGGIGVTYSGEVASPTQTGCGTNYWSPATPYLSPTVDNAPFPLCDIITLVGGSTLPANTITFSSAVTNPIMAIVSLGRAALPVNYTFGQPFDVLSFGPGFFGGPGTLTELAGNVLNGLEGHGAIQFLGTFTSISWTATPSEFWHGFTVGIAATAVVPEPASLALLGLGLAAAAYRLRRRRP